MNDQRGRNFRFLIYPETAMNGWGIVLRDVYQIQGFISPLHDPDGVTKLDLIKWDESPDPEVAAIKDMMMSMALKPHYHGVIVFDGKKSISQVRKIIGAVGGIVPPFNIAHAPSLRPAVRYLIHKDNPDKQQWERGSDMITCLGGVDARPYFEMTTDEIDFELARIRRIIDELHITEYSDLMKYADQSDPVAARLLNSKYTYVISKYIDSKRHKPDKYDKYRVVVDEIPENVH